MKLLQGGRDNGFLTVPSRKNPALLAHDLILGQTVTMPPMKAERSASMLVRRKLLSFTGVHNEMDTSADMSAQFRPREVEGTSLSVPTENTGALGHRSGRWT